MMSNSFWMISKDDHIIDLKYSFYGIPILQKDISLIIAIFKKDLFGHDVFVVTRNSDLAGRR